MWGRSNSFVRDIRKKICSVPLGQLSIYGIPLFFLIAWIRPYLPIEHHSLCAVKTMLGVDCPGCGMTRSIVALTHGNILESISFHPLGIVLVSILLILWVRAIYLSCAKRDGSLVGQGSGVQILTLVFIVALFFQWLAYLWIERSNVLNTIIEKFG